MRNHPSAGKPATSTVAASARPASARRENWRRDVARLCGAHALGKMYRVRHAGQRRNALEQRFVVAQQSVARRAGAGVGDDIRIAGRTAAQVDQIVEA